MAFIDERLGANDIVASAPRGTDTTRLAESFNGLYGWELRHGPWRGLDGVEFGTLTYVDWFNQRRLHGEIVEHGYVTPADFEAAYYRQSVVVAKAATH